MRSRIALSVALFTFLTVVAGTAPPASAVSPPYVTILFSRSQWGPQDGCVVPAGAVTLPQIAADLAARGWHGTGSVVTSYPATTGLHCTRGGIYPTWSTLEDLHTRYGFRFVSHSATYPDMTLLTTDRQRAESCGTVPTLASHGFTEGWGMFSYPNNRRSPTIQTDVVSRCFAFARRYSTVRNSAAALGAPWWANVWTVNGGACNDPAAACWSLATRFRYQNPFALQTYVKVGAGQWAVVQFHTLVTGSRTVGRLRWDCSATDWRRHWTNNTEVYCWADYQRVLGGIPTGAIVTDPATVARAWASNPAVLSLHG